MLDFITWTVNPSIVHLGPFEIRWYGLFFAIGFLAGYKIIEKMFKHEKVPDGWLDKLFIYVVVATIVGARLGHCLFYARDYYMAHPTEIFKIWEGGLASHGGAIGIIIAIWIYSRHVTHRNMLWTFDRLVIPVALVGALIRTGNLMNHEIYGHVTNLPWGFRFIDNLHAWDAGSRTCIYGSLASYTNIRSLMLPGPFRLAHVYVLETKRGRTAGTYFRGISDRYIPTPFPYRVCQKQSGSF